MRQSKAHPLRKINFTRDYDMFDRLPHNINRKIYRAHVRVLEKSMLLMGSLRVVICAHLDFLDRNKLYVIDGQHLIEASRRVDDEVAYVIISIGNKKELIRTIALLNSSAKSWKMSDYVLSWSWLIRDYKVLLNAFEEHNLPLSACVCAYSMIETRNTIDVKEGDFRILDKVAGDTILDYLDELYTVIPRSNRTVARMFTEQFVQMYYKNKRAYNHKAFFAYIKRNARHMATLPEQIKEWQMFLAGYKKK